MDLRTTRHTTSPQAIGLIPILKRFDVFAEIKRLSGKAGAAGWVETLPVSTNAASEPLYSVPQGCAGF